MEKQKRVMTWLQGLSTSINLLAKNRPFLLLLLGDIAVGFAFEIIDFPLITYMLSLGYETIAIGRLISIGLIAMVITQVPAGFLIDRMGRKNGILLGLCIYAIFPIFYPFYADYFWFIIAAVISGIANAILTPASLTFFAEVVPTELRGMAMTLAYFVSGILTFGPFVGAILYVMNRTIPFVVCSVLTIVTIVAFYILLQPSRKRNTTSKATQRTKALTKVFKKSLVGIFIAIFAYSFGAGMLSLIVPVFLLSVLGEPIIQTGLALVVPQVICFVVSLFSGRWMSEGKRKKLLIIGLIGCGIVAPTFTLVRTVFEAVLAWTLLLLTGLFIGAASSTMVAELTEEHSRATAMSVYSFFGTLGIIISLQVVSNPSRMSLASLTPFYVTPLLCALGGIIVYMTVKEKS